MTKPKTVFLIGLVTGILYEGAVRTHVVPAGDGITQPQSNTIRLERFATDHRNGDIVLVGSSMVANLQRQPRLDNVVSLGLEGYSPLTGLRAVVVSGASPKAVVIEVADPLLKGVNKPTIEDEFGVWSKLKKHIWSMRTGYSPFVVLHGVFKRKLSKGNGETIASRELLKQLIDQETDPGSKPLTKKEKAEFDESLHEMQMDVMTLTHRGTKVFLVRIPREPEVDGMARNHLVVDSVTKLFEGTSCQWLDIPVKGQVHTRDALHMVNEEAADFRSHLLAQVEEKTR